MIGGGGIATFNFKKVAGNRDTPKNTCTEDMVFAWERGLVTDWNTV